MKFQRIALWLLAALLVGCTAQPTPTPLPPTAVPLSGRLTFAGSTTLQPLVAKMGDVFRAQHPAVVLDVAAGGSVVGIQAIHDGTVDLGMASRALTESEAKGIEQHQVAVDAIVMVVAEANKVRNLSLEQLGGIYNGKIKDWKEVGGEDKPIVVVVREKSSGTRGAFDDIVLKGKEPAAPDLRVAITAGDMAALVLNNPSAIGYVGFGNLEKGLAQLSINNVQPTVATVKDKSYPLVRPLLLMSGPLSQPLARAFVDFALSPEGQRLVQEYGWVSVE